jgi:hypothetical protein
MGIVVVVVVIVVIIITTMKFVACRKDLAEI